MSFKKTQNINQEIFTNSKSLMITFWEISQIANTDEVIRFHGGVNNMFYS